MNNEETDFVTWGVWDNGIVLDNPRFCQFKRDKYDTAKVVDIKMNEKSNFFLILHSDGKILSNGVNSYGCIGHNK